MSSDLVILRDGRVEQTGSPQLLYQRPASRFVASFLGDSNFIEGAVDGAEDDRFRYSVKGGSFLQAGAPSPQGADGSVLLALRPEKIAVGGRPTSAPNSVEGRIVDLKFFGASYALQVATDRLGRLMVKATAGQLDFEPAIAAPVWLGWAPDAAVVVRPG